LKPTSWPRRPTVIMVTMRNVDTDIPIWQIPKVVISVLITGTEDIDNRVITRDMVHPTTTASGAQVLIPNWSLINPVLLEMFGQ
jgi:polyisoprenyl-teichoic acid--peptidoglycan teichoic acid transferase